jgi:hypothetical protein
MDGFDAPGEQEKDDVCIEDLSVPEKGLSFLLFSL